MNDFLRPLFAATRGRAAAVTIVATGLALSASPAVASEWIELAPGTGGPQEEEGGAGHEQATVAAVTQGGVTYLVTIYMSSNVDDEDGPWQCKCSSVALDGGPPRIAAERQLTSLNGDRPCNHPKAATDGTHVVWLFGSNDDDEPNVATYAGVVDATCQELAAPMRVSEDDNQNEGAPDVAYNGGGLFTGGYLSTNGEDVTYALGLRLTSGAGQTTLEKTYLQEVVSPANIGRPAIVGLDGSTSVVCAAKGDQRPPEDGVECAYIDAESGEILSKELLFESDEEQGIYMNQPSVALFGDGRMAVQVIESSGQGKKKNGKGSSLQQMAIVEPGPDGFLVLSRATGIGPYQTHSGLCSGAFGTSAERTLGILDAPVTGSSQATFTMVRMSGTELIADEEDWIAGPYNGDSGYLANIYGQNPNTQGRDFLRCIGDVPNPGFGTAGAFMSESKSLFAIPYAGRKPDDEKNALFMSLIPGETSAPIGPNGPVGEKPGAGGGDKPGLGSTEGGCTFTGSIPTSSPGQSRAAWMAALFAALILRRRRSA
jgi:hypothetical protein